MVVFTCNHCGESLQKPKVEKHYQTVCRRVKSLTCVDCFKDFRGEDFKVHIKCITEEERYAAKGSIQGGIVKKGEAKQESWVDMFRSIITKEPNLTPNIKNLLETIANYNNIPRKKHKFMNFIKSSSGGHVDMRAVEEVWNLIEKYKQQTVKTNPENVKDEKEKENVGKRKLDKNEEESNVKKMKMENGNTEENRVEKKKKKKNKQTNGSEKMIEDSQENDIEKKKNKQENGVAKMIKDCEETGVEKMIVDSEESCVEEGKQKKEGNGVEINKKENGLEVSKESSSKKKKKNKKNKNGIPNCEDNSKNGEESKMKEIVKANDENTTKNKKKGKSNDKENIIEGESENKINENNDSNNKQTEGFSFEETILNILKKKNNVPLKKLQKKVLNAFIKHNDLTEATEKHIKKFSKKLNKMQAVKVESDNVALIE